MSCSPSVPQHSNIYSSFFHILFFFFQILLNCHKQQNTKPETPQTQLLTLIFKSLQDLPKDGLGSSCIAASLNIDRESFLNYLRQKNTKSGWLTWSNLNQLSAASKSEFTSWRSEAPFGLHSDPLNLYVARPKTGKEILGRPSTPLGYVTTGACAFWSPVKFTMLSVIEETTKQTGKLIVHS